jgi:hypothetical protein
MFHDTPKVKQAILDLQDAIRENKISWRADVWEYKGKP